MCTDSMSEPTIAVRASGGKYGILPEQDSRRLSTAVVSQVHVAANTVLTPRLPNHSTYDHARAPVWPHAAIQHSTIAAGGTFMTPDMPASFSASTQSREQTNGSIITIARETCADAVL